MLAVGGVDLFREAAEARRAADAPLAERLRPRSLEEVVGQEHLLGPGRPLRVLIETDRVTSLVLWGPPGVGKTTLARLIARRTAKAFEPLSAVTAGVTEVREVVERARRRLGEHGQGTILFLDEIHRFTRTQQDALLPHLEDGLLRLVGATTENPFFSLTAPLLSRSTVFRLEPLRTAEVALLLRRALRDERGLGGRRIVADDAALAHLVDRADGDARHALSALEVAASLAVADDPDHPVITVERATAALAVRALRYGPDEHYDTVSAFIKSIRGSDADAGLYWLARMLEAGEDPRFIARRLVILASEDIGLADSQALQMAVAAAHAVELVGLPEARLNLAHAVVYLARAPKSNRVLEAIAAATADVRDRPAGPVPLPLRDAHVAGTRRLGHGVGYRYPHDAPDARVDQEYRPPEVAGRVYYRPSGRGDDRDAPQHDHREEPGRDARR